MRLHTICVQHHATALVGPGTLLSELECVTCVAIADGILPGPEPTDPEALFISRITRHHNGNCCCGTCEPEYCYLCNHYMDFCTCLYVEVKSPNYCDGKINPDDVPF